MGYSPAMQRLRPLSRGAVAALALAALAAPLPGPGGRAAAQGAYDARGYRPGSAAQDYYGGRSASRPPPPPAEEPRQFYWPWEDRPAPRPAAPPPAAPRYGSPEPRGRGYADDVRPAPRRRPPPQRVAAPPPAPAAKPKPSPAVQVAVFGDSLAVLLGQGLDEAFAENPDVGVARRARADTGLVRRDVADWPKLAEDYVKANPKLTYAVVMFAANDRQPIRDGDQSVDPLTDRWRELYRDRVDAMVKVLSDAKVGVLWVGAPPMKADTLSRDLSAMNDIDRERVQRAGGTYVDIWPAFVDDANRYTATGPDLDGRSTRLRLGDGVHFTHAGARKAAHFVDVEIRKLMEGRGLAPGATPEAVAATPPPTVVPGAKADEPAPADRRSTASLPIPPEAPAAPVKPVAGPVVPLTRTELSPGGALIAGRPRLEGDAGRAIERSLVRGTVPAAPPGRADDFTWPAN